MASCGSRLLVPSNNLPENIRDDPCIRIPGFNGKLGQYQCLTMFTMLSFMLDEKKNGFINAEQPGMGKFRPYFI